MQAPPGPPLSPFRGRRARQHSSAPGPSVAARTTRACRHSPRPSNPPLRATDRPPPAGVLIASPHGTALGFRASVPSHGRRQHTRGRVLRPVVVRSQGSALGAAVWSRTWLGGCAVSTPSDRTARRVMCARSAPSDAGVDGAPRERLRIAATRDADCDARALCLCCGRGQAGLGWQPRRISEQPRPAVARAV